MDASEKKEELLKQSFADFVERHKGGVSTGAEKDFDDMGRYEAFFVTFRAGWKAAEDADLWGDE